MSIIYDTFDDGGWLSKAIPLYKSRPQQVKFAMETARALVKEGVLLAECPPGVGKSFGYCVPVIGMVSKTPVVEREKSVPIYENGKVVSYDTEIVEDNFRAIIVTANIALQEQLIEKDLPMLREVMPFEFRFALAKGRTNYLCYDFVHSDAAAQVEMFDQDSAMELGDLLQWARTTETGDISDLDYIPNKAAWAELTKSGDECRGKKCKSYLNCFVRKARAGIKEAHIVVCNYHLFFTHLAFGTTVLPEYDAVIMDEAHNAVDIARDIFGWRLTYAAIRRAVAPLRRIKQGETRVWVLNEARSFLDDLKRYYESDSYRARLKEKDPVQSEHLMEALQAAVREYYTVEENDLSAERRQDARLWKAKCEAVMERIREVMALSTEGAVYYLEVDHREHVTICCRTIDVSKELYAGLFSETPTVILTSATLAVRGSMQHLKKDLGIWNDNVQELIVGSPFDLAKQAMMVVPRDAPHPDNSEAVANYVERCINAAGGRTLCLFTSYRNLAVTRDRLRERTTWNVLAQGEMPRTKLVAKFRADVKSVLLGVDSFWAGIDVPGESLSCLVIDRLPFPTPEDPILDATKERGEPWFMSYSIPRAVTAFRQGAGRLIRSVHDRGVIVVLDSRIVKKQYGALFTSSFPKKMRIAKKIEAISEFL